MNLIDILDVYALENDTDNMLLFFDDYVLDNRIDKDVMNTTIISELGAMIPLTTNPDLYKILFDNFFKKYASNISKLLDTMYYEYNPLHNKDLVETEHRESVGDIDNTDKYTTKTEQNEDAEQNEDIDGTVEQQVSAYDTSAYQPKQKEDTITSSKRTNDIITTNDVEHEGETTSDIESTVDLERNITGKDGQDSYQSLISQERKLAEFNIFNWIIKRMREELFLLVY